MDQVELLAQAESFAHAALEWIGFGAVVGLLAKAIMPGRDPGGALVTLAMGVGGTVIGCATVSYFYRGQYITPISPLGFLVATAGALMLLVFYRLMGGFWFREDLVPRVSGRRVVRTRVRRGEPAEYVQVE